MALPTFSFCAQFHFCRTKKEVTKCFQQVFFSFTVRYIAIQWKTRKLRKHKHFHPISLLQLNKSFDVVSDTLCRIQIRQLSLLTTWLSEWSQRTICRLSCSSSCRCGLISIKIPELLLPLCMLTEFIYRKYNFPPLYTSFIVNQEYSCVLSWSYFNLHQ